MTRTPAVTLSLWWDHRLKQWAATARCDGGVPVVRYIDFQGAIEGHDQAQMLLDAVRKEVETWLSF